MPNNSSSDQYVLGQYLAPLWRSLLYTFCAVVLILVVAPCVYLIIWCFYGTDVVGVLRPIEQPTFKWFAQFFRESEWTESLIYSVLVATAIAIVGTASMVVYSYSVRFGSWLIDVLSLACCVLILLTPPVAFAIALRFVGGGMDASEWLMLLTGHLVLILPLQFLVFEAARETCSDQMLIASHTLGASHWKTLILVYTPNMVRPIVFSAVIGFFVSFDEVVVAIFVIDSATVTIPRRLWNEASQLATPEPAVIAVLLLSIFTIILLVSETIRLILKKFLKRRRF